MLSVMLPLYNACSVAWLALEGLSRQTGVTVEWELIACEEREGHAVLGEAALRSYTDRLQQAGCISIKYIELPEWVSLSRKYIAMAEHIDPRSTVCLIQGADNYPCNDRLAWTWQMFAADCDVLHCPVGNFMDLATGKLLMWNHAQYRNSSGSKSQTSGVDMAFASWMWKKWQMPHKRAAGNDSWALRESRRVCRNVELRHLRIVTSTPAEWQTGLVTRGLNNLSLREWGTEPHFSTVDYGWRDVLPEELHGQMLATMEIAGTNAHELIRGRSVK